MRNYNEEYEKIMKQTTEYKVRILKAHFTQLKIEIGKAFKEDWEEIKTFFRRIFK